MGRRSAIRFLADVHDHGHAAYAACGRCARTVALNILELMQRHGPLLTVDELRARVRCTRCGRRTGDVRIVYGSRGRR